MTICLDMPPNPITIRNIQKQIRQVKPQLYEDACPYDREKLTERAKSDIAAKLTTVTQYDYESSEIERLMTTREYYIKLRNSIVDNPLKRVFAIYNKKLSQIDARLDEIDLLLYSLEKNKSGKDTDLKKIISDAKKSLEKDIDLLIQFKANIPHSHG